MIEIQQTDLLTSNAYPNLMEAIYDTVPENEWEAIRVLKPEKARELWE